MKWNLSTTNLQLEHLSLLMLISTCKTVLKRSTFWSTEPCVGRNLLACQILEHCFVLHNSWTVSNWRFLIHPFQLFFVFGVVKSQMFEIIIADPFCFRASFQELVQVRVPVKNLWDPLYLDLVHPLSKQLLCAFFFFILNWCTSSISFYILKVKFYLAIISKSWYTFGSPHLIMIIMNATEMLLTTMYQITEQFIPRVLSFFWYTFSIPNFCKTEKMSGQGMNISSTGAAA